MLIQIIFFGSLSALGWPRLTKYREQVQDPSHSPKLWGERVSITGI